MVLPSWKRFPGRTDDTTNAQKYVISCICNFLFYPVNNIFILCDDHQDRRTYNPKLRDGLYEGIYKGGLNKAVVEVRIESNKIVDIKVVEHKAMKGIKAEPIIPKRIMERQSTDVDAVSGATNSSYVIMNAVQKALEKAYVD